MHGFLSLAACDIGPPMVPKEKPDVAVLGVIASTQKEHRLAGGGETTC